MNRRSFLSFLGAAPIAMVLPPDAVKPETVLIPEVGPPVLGTFRPKFYSGEQMRQFTEALNGLARDRKHVGEVIVGPWTQKT